MRDHPQTRSLPSCSQASLPQPQILSTISGTLVLQQSGGGVEEREHPHLLPRRLKAVSDSEQTADLSSQSRTIASMSYFTQRVKTSMDRGLRRARLWLQSFMREASLASVLLSETTRLRKVKRLAQACPGSKR